MKILVLILGTLVLFSGTVMADPTDVTHNIAANANMSGDGLLHAPRYQILPMSGVDSVLLLAQGSSTNIVISTDALSTVSGYLDDGPYGNNHDHGFLYNDTLYRWGRNVAEADSTLYVIYDVKNNVQITGGGGLDMGWGGACGYTSATPSVVRIGDLLVMAIRGYDCSFRYALSDDNMASYSTGEIADYSDGTTGIGGTNTRQGLFVAFTDSTAVMSGWLGWEYGGTGTADTIALWWFDTSDSSWTRENALVGDKLSRFYSANTSGDSLITVATWGGEIDSLLIVGTRRVSQAMGTWDQDTLIVEDDGESTPAAGLTEIAESGRMVMWTQHNGNLTFWYQADDLSWVGPDTVIGNDTSLADGELQVPQRIPASHGSQAYCQVKTTGGTVYMIRADITEGSGFDGYTEITSLPETLDVRAGKYYLSSNLTWPGGPTLAGITITADSVTLDLNNTTYIYGTADSGYNSAIKVDHADTVTIRNGTIRHNPTDSSLDLNMCRSIWVENAAYTKIVDVDVSVTGTVVENTLWRSAPYTTTTSGRYHNHGIHTIYIQGQDSHHNWIDSCTVTNSVVGYYERSDRPAVAIACAAYISNTGITDPATDYTLKVTNTTASSPHDVALLGCAVGCTGDYGVFHVEDNDFINRARNDGPHAGYRYGNTFAVDYYHAALFRSARNYITYDTSEPYFGGCGFFLVSAGGDGGFAGDTNYSTYDTIIAGGGPEMGYVSGIKIRGGNRPTIFSNMYLQADADTLSLDSTLDDRAHCVEIGHSYDAADWDNDHIEFTNCTFNAVDSSGGSTLYNMFYRFWPIGFGYKLFTSGCNFTTDETVFAFADAVTSDQVQADSIFSYSDTFNLGSNHDGAELFTIYYNSLEARYNYIINPTYGAGAAWGFDYGTSNTQDLTEQFEMVVMVEDAGENLVNGANVWAVNSISPDTLFKKTTGVSGVVYDTVSTNFISREYADTTLAQYNDFTVGAAYDGDTTTVTFTLSYTVNDTTLTFGTATAPSNRPSVLSDNLRISGKVIIK